MGAVIDTIDNVFPLSVGGEGFGDSPTSSCGVSAESGPGSRPTGGWSGSGYSQTGTDSGFHIHRYCGGSGRSGESLWSAAVTVNNTYLPRKCLTRNVEMYCSRLSSP